MKIEGDHASGSKSCRLFVIHLRLCIKPESVALRYLLLNAHGRLSRGSITYLFRVGVWRWPTSSRIRGHLDRSGIDGRRSGKSDAALFNVSIMRGGGTQDEEDSYRPLGSHGHKNPEVHPTGGEAVEASLQHDGWPTFLTPVSPRKFRSMTCFDNCEITPPPTSTLKGLQRETWDFSNDASKLTATQQMAQFHTDRKVTTADCSLYEGFIKISPRGHSPSLFIAGSINWAAPSTTNKTAKTMGPFALEEVLQLKRAPILLMLCASRLKGMKRFSSEQRRADITYC